MRKRKRKAGKLRHLGVTLILLRTAYLALNIIHPNGELFLPHKAS